MPQPGTDRGPATLHYPQCPSPGLTGAPPSATASLRPAVPQPWTDRGPAITGRHPPRPCHSLGLPGSLPVPTARQCPGLGLSGAPPSPTIRQRPNLEVAGAPPSPVAFASDIAFSAWFTFTWLGPTSWVQGGLAHCSPARARGAIPPLDEAVFPTQTNRRQGGAGARVNPFPDNGGGGSGPAGAARREPSFVP